MGGTSHICLACVSDGAGSSGASLLHRLGAGSSVAPLRMVAVSAESNTLFVPKFNALEKENKYKEKKRTRNENHHYWPEFGNENHHYLARIRCIRHYQ